jgi:S-adenosylmethionine:tRNA ribosyltransferase-isomerase
VIHARLLGHKVDTGGRAELLLVRPAATVGTDAALKDKADALEWICLGQSSKGFKPNVKLAFAEGLQAEVLESVGGGEYRVRFHSTTAEPLGALIERAGKLPLPPYVDRPADAEDEQRYQTVFAERGGSVAAPTAGLHFTDELLSTLSLMGISHVKLTLDVGPGTFLPIRDGDVDTHKMHEERFNVPPSVADAVNQARRESRRVVAVGTTVVRTLESATDEQGLVRAGESSTALFIKPGFQFRQVDALVTNFHLPKSTLLLLVSAFAGKEPMLRAYKEAVARGYRFFSFGDAMLIG